MSDHGNNQTPVEEVSNHVQAAEPVAKDDDSSSVRSHQSPMSDEDVTFSLNSILKLQTHKQAPEVPATVPGDSQVQANLQNDVHAEPEAIPHSLEAKPQHTVNEIVSHYSHAEPETLPVNTVFVQDISDTYETQKQEPEHAATHVQVQNPKIVEQVPVHSEDVSEIQHTSQTVPQPHPTSKEEVAQQKVSDQHHQNKDELKTVGQTDENDYDVHTERHPDIIHKQTQPAQVSATDSHQATHSHQATQQHGQKHSSYDMGQTTEHINGHKHQQEAQKTQHTQVLNTPQYVEPISSKDEVPVALPTNHHPQPKTQTTDVQAVRAKHQDSELDSPTYSPYVSTVPEPVPTKNNPVQKKSASNTPKHKSDDPNFTSINVPEPESEAQKLLVDSVEPVESQITTRKSAIGPTGLKKAPSKEQKASQDTDACKCTFM